MLVNQGREAIPNWIGVTASWLLSVAMSALLLLALTILTLLSGPSLLAGMLKTVPRLAERGAWRVLEGAYRDVSRYAGGQLAIALTAGVSAYVVMLLTGVEHALPLAAFIAVLALVPIVGAFVGGGAAVLVATADEWWKGAAMLAFLLVYQQIESNVLGPAILGHVLKVSALVVLVAIAAGYALLGIPGMIVAIPIAATLQIVLSEYRKLHEQEQPELVERAERRIEHIDPER